jgi:polysaccharide deacetylase family sporulation protein PdaB
MVYKDRYFWEKTGDVVWEVKTEKKLVALTFDDGPSPTFTSQILNLLDQYNAKATFFIIGKEAEKYPNLIMREFKEGHEIANHTYSHQEVTEMSEYELKVELRQTHKIIQQIIGEDVKLFRPTSGYYADYIVRVARSLDYTVIIWTWGQDSRDWTQRNGELIAKRIIKTVKPGDIILFHDRGGDRSNTIKALQIILPVLKEKGYKFVTVSEILKNRKNEIENVSK